MQDMYHPFDHDHACSSLDLSAYSDLQEKLTLVCTLP